MWDNPNTRIIAPFDKAFGWTLQDTRTAELSFVRGLQAKDAASEALPLYQDFDNVRSQIPSRS